MTASVGVASLYDILEVTEHATRDDIRLSYQRLLLQYHPDKRAGERRRPAAETAAAGDPAGSSAATEEHLRQRLDDVLRAWYTLGDTTRRADYDKQLRAARLCQPGPMDVEVDLDDMDYDEDTGVFTYACRCSGAYTLTEDDLEVGADLVGCAQCSLRIRVLYQAADETE
ncbi:CSL zinc finger-domain-containing protein [Thamnocephalis sphaerospora]|uniref:Diphthamide biosynthesis protein 4 n=1 Tax=Thamnocephalis sphaerospora TaxID=78915 RepID=A0A4P9XXX3_9FUNG|nr:CSL zinc finger-domain-containing protein [Thamnocephalis sphaerospora]|eukprot:RKP10922.1 CSL zinc finger-domain-containing protein [Thamnocephalis sphaerospora]